jgi:hypothetical protein
LDHALEAMPNLDWELAADSALGSVRRQCAIFNVAWFDKVRGKYGNFGYSVVHYDSGVLSALGALVCKTLGLRFDEYVGGDSHVIVRALGLESDWRPYLSTSVLGVGEEPPSPPSQRLQPTFDLIQNARRPRAEHENDFEWRAERARSDYPALRQASGTADLMAVLGARRSTNRFGEAPIGGALITDLMRLAKAANRERHLTGGFRLHIWPLLLRARGGPDLPAGIYSAEDEDGLLRLRRNHLSNLEMSECINQLGLATAGDIMVMVADVPAAVQAYGETGYRALLMRAGSMVAEMWLAAEAAGVKSTAAGGALEPGLLKYAGCDGYRECPLLSFVVGSAAEGPSQEQVVH